MIDPLVPVDFAAHLIGVIDLRGGLAVHAIAGKRTEYQPTTATGVPAGDALKLAMRYHRLGVNSFYIADLDAICHGKPNVPVLSELVTSLSSCLIDAGACAVELALRLPPAKSLQFVLATESFESIDQWSEACEAIGSDRVVLGLDLDGNRLRTQMSSQRKLPSGTLPAQTHSAEGPTEVWSNVAPWIEQAVHLGVARLLVLDLAYVGTAQGPGCAESCRIIRTHQKNLPMISGGGVRTFDDVTKMLQSGCDQVLVGTALHHDNSAATLLGMRR